jgi:hypothetical protein
MRRPAWGRSRRAELCSACPQEIAWDGAFVFASVSFSTPTTPGLLFRPPNRRHEFFQECCLALADYAASLG